MQDLLTKPLSKWMQAAVIIKKIEGTAQVTPIQNMEHSKSLSRIAKIGNNWVKPVYHTNIESIANKNRALSKALNKTADA